MDLSSINEEKIRNINDGLWTVNRYEFYVEIKNENNNHHDDYEYCYRIISQNELRAIQKQIIVSKLDDDGNEENPYSIFIDRFNKMSKYRKIVEFLNLQGIAKFESINRREFERFEEAFDDYDDDDDYSDDDFHNKIKIYKTMPKINFLTDSIQHSSFRVIGEIIHSNANLLEKLTPYVRCIVGTQFSQDILEKILKNFLEIQSIDDSFDSFKLGYKFCQYLSNQKIEYKFNNFQINEIIEKIKQLSNTIGFDFSNKLEHSFRKSNLIFLKVIRPSHCYHCILSVTRIISTFKAVPPFFPNERTLIFCRSGSNFVEKITNISKISNNDSNLTYFIVHPEMLNEEDHSFLVEFLDSRMNSIFNQKLPKIFIISSLDYQTFYCNHLKKFNEIEIKIPRELISLLCDLSQPIDTDYLIKRSYQLYYSENAGSGKTYQIIQDFKNKRNCVIDVKEKDSDHILKSLFVDASMTNLPKLEYFEKEFKEYEENNCKSKEYNYVHLDLSPELFDDNYHFFDNLWTYTVLNYKINSDGTSSNIPNNIFFEVPTLTKKQFPEGGFIDKADFPIYCDYYHKITTIKKDGDEEKALNSDEILETPTQIRIPESIKQFCKIVFEKDIEYTSELLKMSLEMFYPNIKFDESCFVPRLLEEINIFMDQFCNNLSLDDENSKAMFLILLRTNFHVWNMESLFTQDNQPKSFIIFSNQNLFSNRLDKNKWILLCFSSIEEPKIIWNTKYLKDDIKNLGEIDESNLFDCKLFRNLTKNPNIEIFTNQGNYNNYENDQAYFFNIIKTFFYLNENKDTTYRKITDGVIFNDVKNNESYEKIKDVLPAISEGKDIYIKNRDYVMHHEWTKVFDILYSIFHEYDSVNPNELFDAMAKEERVVEISNIILSMTLVKRFVIMILRLILKQPFILEGFTGVGKTYCVKLLRILIEIASENKDFNWSYHQIDCHCGLHIDELLRIREEKFSQKPIWMNYILIFDELNTSPASNYVINEMNNYYLKKINLPSNKTSNSIFDNSSVVFIAATNPYVTVDKFTCNLSRVGIHQIIPSRISKLKLCCKTPKDNKNLYEITDLNKLAYNVQELSNPTKMMVIKSDPELFIFNDDDDKVEKSIYYPPDEKKTIGLIIDSFLNILINQTNYFMPENILKNSKATIIEDDEKRENNLNTIQETIEENKYVIGQIILDLISKSFIEIRELMQMKSVLSFRDVKRMMQFFILFFTKLVKVFIRREDSPDIKKEDLTDKIIPQSIVLSVMISIVFRFSNETIIETSDGNISYSNEDEEKILARCKKFGLKLTFSKDKSYCKVGVRSALLEKLMKIEWPKLIKKPENWNDIVISYAWLKCLKYIYDNDEINDSLVNSSLLKFNSLMINLFSISSCYSACKNNKEIVIPCMIIGMPGTSKTLATQLFTNYKQKFGKSKYNFFSSTYLSTRDSESESLNAHYKNCAMFMKTHKDSFSVCVIDELGLANLNETHPLKLLHYYFDKGIRIKSDYNSINVPVMSIATSIYALDYSIMNRGILISTDLPTDEDIAEAFLLSELERNSEINIKSRMHEYKNRYFDDDYDFFDWKRKFRERIPKYQNFLQILWELTDKKERPDKLNLGPIYLLFNSIFHNRKPTNNDELVNSLCLYLISIISCNSCDSFEKVKELINKLFPLEDDNDDFSLKKIINEQKESNLIAFKEIFNGPSNSDFYYRFCDIVNEQVNEVKKRGKRVAYKLISDLIKENMEEAFEELHQAMKTKDGDYYKALENISDPGFKFRELTKDINDSNYDNYKILRQYIISTRSGGSKRALCLRTKNYECLDFIEELLDTTTRHYYEDADKNIQFVHIYPDDFKLPKQINSDIAIEKLIDIISETKDQEDDTLYFFLIVGNSFLTDALLDLLNSPNEGKGIPLISINGFTVELNEFPKNIIFCFIMNEQDFINDDSANFFHFSLFDRLNQLYFDYDSKDVFGIIEKHKDFHEENVGYSTPYSEIIHDYFNRFVSRLKDVPIPSGDDEYAVVIATTDISAKDYFTEGVDFEEFELEDKYEKITWKKKIILAKFFRISRKFVTCQKNIDKFEDDEDHDIIFYWSNELDKLYEIKKEQSVFDIPLPKPDNYDYYLDNDGSINNLIEIIENGEIDVFESKKRRKKKKAKKEIRAIIVTTSPLMEKLNINNNEIGINEENTIFLFDQCITSHQNFEERIESENDKKNIIVQSNHFQIEHDRYLRYLLEKQTDKSYTIIIYHIKNNKIPEGLYTSKKWPVFWIESITNSPLSKFSTTEIVDCILFNDVYKEKMNDLLTRIFKHVYDDIDAQFETHVDITKINEIINFIFISLTKLRNSNGKSILDINFKDLIDKFEGKKIKDSFKNLDLKREFCNTIINQIPFLENLMKLIVLNQDVINDNPIEYTQSFLTHLFSYQNIEKLFEKAEFENINYDLLNHNGLYFTELILPSVLSIYKVFHSKDDNHYPEIDKKTFKIFYKMQDNSNNKVDPSDILENYCNNYFISYLNENQTYIESELDGFYEKLKELVK